MKITIKGPNLHNILVQMRGLIEAAKLENISGDVSEKAKSSALPSESYEFKSVGAQGPGPDLFDEPAAPVDKPVVKPVDKPAKTVNPQIAKMQAAKAAKKAEREAAAAAPPPVDKPEPKKAKAAEPIDPAEMVKIRQKTIADLQDAYANGHQAEVFELLSRFGNGAKSFRELPPDAFVPISEAIAKGALT
jgi:hypothetical protein